MDIVPTGVLGQQKVSEARVKQVWEAVNTKAAWDALTAGQRSEVMRRVVKWLVKENFGELVDDGD
jgi:hypothetical protein